MENSQVVCSICGKVGVSETDVHGPCGLREAAAPPATEQGVREIAPDWAIMEVRKLRYRLRGVKDSGLVDKAVATLLFQVREDALAAAAQPTDKEAKAG